MSDIAAKLNIVNTFDVKVQNAQTKVENDISQTTFFKQKEEGASDNVKLTETHEKEAATGKEKTSANLKQLTGAKDAAEKKLEAAKLKGADPQELEKLQKDVEDIQKKIDGAKEADKKADEKIEEVKEEKIETQKKLEKAQQELKDNETTIKKDEEELKSLKEQQTTEQNKIDEEVKKEELKQQEELKKEEELKLEEEKNKESTEKKGKLQPNENGKYTVAQLVGWCVDKGTKIANTVYNDTVVPLSEEIERIRKGAKDIGINLDDTAITSDIDPEKLKTLDNAGSVTAKSKGSQTEHFDYTTVDMTVTSVDDRTKKQQEVSIGGSVNTDADLTDKLHFTSKTGFSAEAVKEASKKDGVNYTGNVATYDLNFTNTSTFTNTMINQNPLYDGITNLNVYSTIDTAGQLGTDSSRFSGSVENGANLSARLTDGLTAHVSVSNKTGFDTEGMTLTNNFNANGGFALGETLYENEEKQTKLSISGTANQGFSFNTVNSFANNQSSWDANMHTDSSVAMNLQTSRFGVSGGFSNSFDIGASSGNGVLATLGSEGFVGVNFKANDNLLFGAEGNAGITLSSNGDNNYSVGTKLYGTWQNDSTQFTGFVSYKQSDSFNGGNLKQIIGAGAGVGLTDDLGLSALVERDLKTQETSFTIAARKTF